MAASSLATIRAALAAALSAAYPDAQVSAYRLDSPSDHCLQVIGTRAVNYDQAMQLGLHSWIVQIQALCGSPVTRVAQQLLDVWRDGDGVKAAIEADITLGGIVQACRVETASEDQIYTNNNVHSLGCLFEVAIWNLGS